MLYDILLYITLAAIFLQDLRYRAVTWIYIPVAVICILLSQLSVFSLHTIMQNTLLCIGLLAIQLSGAVLYFAIRGAGVKDFFNKKLGAGDILAFMVPCFLFSPLNFMVFLTGVYLVSILLYMLLLKKNAQKTIPLAGYLSILLLLLHLATKHVFDINLYIDFPGYL